MPQQPIRMTAISFQGGLTAVAPTDQWLAMLFDVLHPTQQERILEMIRAMGQAQQDRPLILAPDTPHMFERGD